MERLYKYQGMISSLTCKGDKATAIELYDMYDESKAPTRLEVYGGLAKYIYEINCTDAEERYLTADYFFDSNLCLHRIEIPSSVKSVSAKIITSANHLSEKLVIFGPQNYIETNIPKPMEHEQAMWCTVNKSTVLRYRRDGQRGTIMMTNKLQNLINAPRWSGRIGQQKARAK